MIHKYIPTKKDRNMLKIILTVFVAVSLVACKSNIKEEVACSNQDWHQLGVTTAKQGKSVRTFNKYRDNCGDTLDKNAMAQYLDGYSKAIIEYCTYDNGYNIGETGLSKPDICPTELTEKFEKGYSDGARYLAIVKDEMKKENEKQYTTPNTTYSNEGPKEQ